MSFRPPRRFSRGEFVDPVQAALDAEVMQEKANSLSRSARRLEKALEELAAPGTELPGAAAKGREALLDEAAEALWFLIIQRELMGLGGEERVCRDHRVPPAVRARLGIRATDAPR